ncbi:MAG: hypothetical protein KK926_04995 [Methanomethylovorans sp.]|nr:hypothetical protein [Methanomethylovorans sp.]
MNFKNTLNLLKSAEEAVSEIVDFSITMGIMLLSITIIVTAGFPLVGSMQEAQHTENIKQSFTVLTSNINKIAFGSSPSQSVEIKLHESTAAVTGTSSINVDMRVWNSSTSAVDTESFDRQLRVIENRYNERSIGYENTGSWAKYEREKVVMISKPNFAVGEDLLMIPAVMLSGSSSVSGTGLVRVVCDGGLPSVHRYENVSMVNITICSEYYDGWGRFLNETMGMQITKYDAVNDTVSASKQYSPDNIDVVIVYSPMKVTIQ